MKVAVLGYGTVGKGVYEMLGNARGFEKGPVLVRAGKDDEDFKLSDITKITSDPTIEAVVEVMGGIEPAYSYACAAMKAGKHFVTSNKALVAEKATELNKLARENSVAFLFSAACGGGVPFLHNLALAVESDEILSLGGILNGTTNFMLDAMQSKHMDYNEALKLAQELGFAEADPKADVSGLDALRKIMLACAVSYSRLPTDGIFSEGIESITAEDVWHFKQLGLVCRLIAKASLNKNASVSAYVEPMLFPDTAVECSVKKNFNMAKYEGSFSGSMVLIGQGAGRKPTASAVLRDLTDITQGRRNMLSESCIKSEADNSEAYAKYYIRCKKACASIFEAEIIYNDADCVRFLSKAISAKEMYGKAQDIRKSGESIFFAAMQN